MNHRKELLRSLWVTPSISSLSEGTRQYNLEEPQPRLGGFHGAVYFSLHLK